MFMSVVDRDFAQHIERVAAAFWTAAVGADEAGADSPAGRAEIGGVGDLGFVVTRAALNGVGVLGCEPLSAPTEGWALRLDEVAFPVGAVAHRHTHSGSGWRYLLRGELRIEAEQEFGYEAGHETAVMTTGSRWFEPALSPVRAVALQTTGITRFVRCMVIPLADVGRSTFQLATPADAQLPRLQVTHRHFDHIVQVDAG